MTLTPEEITKLKDNAREMKVYPVLVKGTPDLVRNGQLAGASYINMVDLVRIVEKRGGRIDLGAMRVVWPNKDTPKATPPAAPIIQKPTKPAPAPKPAPAAKPTAAPKPKKLSKEDLEEMPVKDLRVIADSLGIKAGLKKAELVKAILKA